MKSQFAVAAAFAVALAAGQAQASTVNIGFTLTDTANIVVTGEIDGLTVGGTNVAASDVSIHGYTDPTGVTFGFPTPLDITSITTNQFSVDGSGNLTAADFYGKGFYGGGGSYVILSLAMNPGGPGTGGVFQDVPGIGSIIQTGGDFSATFRTLAATTPVPPAALLFASGLAAIGLMRWRRGARLTEMSV